MPKNIVLFSDGTGNSSRPSVSEPTFGGYTKLPGSPADQIAYYDDGVGTSPFKPFALLGGALGLGLKRNVKHLYAFLCRNYKTGDRIYAFGFSRGAFTIRILIGLVPTRDWWLPRPRAGFGDWSKRAGEPIASTPASHCSAKFAKKFHAKAPSASAAANPQVKFNFVGLWDTVAAYGLPADELTRAWDQ